MTYIPTHLRAAGARHERTQLAQTHLADRAAEIVRRMTGQDAADSIARLTLEPPAVPSVVIPYMTDHSQGVEVRVTA